MNMIQMMQQAQKMQKKLKDAQESLKEVEVLGQCAGGAVEVTFDGQTKFILAMRERWQNMKLSMGDVGCEQNLWQH